MTETNQLQLSEAIGLHKGNDCDIKNFAASANPRSERASVAVPSASLILSGPTQLVAPSR